MTRLDHVAVDEASHTAAVKHSTRPRCTLMEAAFIVFFLLFAILAFAWFYLQRAKARTTTTTTVDHPEPDPAARPVDRPE